MIQFKVDTKKFISDPLDGETIIMDMVEGRLFLLEDGAAVVWDHIVKSESRESILTAISTHYGSEVVPACETFLQRLIDLGLVTESSMIEGVEIVAHNDPWPPTLGEFRLTEYDDMMSIITMDPIHDVDPSRGWPFNAKG